MSEDAPQVSGNKLTYGGVEYIAHAVFKSRIDAKQAKLDEATAQLEEARANALSSKKAAEQYEALQREYQEYRSGIEQAEAFRAVGLDGEEHEALRDRLVRLYQVDASAVEDGAERPTLSGWFESMRDDPLVGHYLPAAPDEGDAPPPGDGQPPPAPPRQPGSSAPPPRTRPPSTATKLSPEQVRQKHAQLLARAQGEKDPEAKKAIMSEARTFLRTQGNPPA